jgi:hypothetical protein
MNDSPEAFGSAQPFAVTRECAQATRGLLKSSDEFAQNGRQKSCRAHFKNE